MYQTFIKPLFDFLVALLGVFLLSPVFILAATLLFLTNKGTPFFIQKRPGKNGQIFSIIKFKTMSDKRDAVGHLLADAERLTAVGKFIRKTSLDELPQLINVLKGDMSIVGPRPLLPGYLGLYTPFQARRHEVRPGITGWAQVNGRNAISWEEKFNFDVWYVDHLSFTLDLKILLFTLKKVLKSEGINSREQMTTTPFTGKK